MGVARLGPSDSRPRFVRSNRGDVSAHPELIDINFGETLLAEVSRTREFPRDGSEAKEPIEYAQEHRVSRISGRAGQSVDHAGLDSHQRGGLSTPNSTRSC